MTDTVIIAAIDEQLTDDGRMGWQVDMTKDRVRLILLHPGMPPQIYSFNADQADRIAEAMTTGAAKIRQKLLV